MCELENAIAVPIDTFPCNGQEHIVKTTFGPISVLVCGEEGKPPLITYPDVALNVMSCFQGLFLCPEAASVLLDHFCIYHINAPGHEVGATSVSTAQPILTVDNLADQVAEILDFFNLEEVICMGVTAGAYILTLFAMKYRERAIGLILISPLCQVPSWTEWFCNKLMINLLYFYGMCSVVKEILLRRYFSPDLRMCNNEESDIVQTCSRMLDERHGHSVLSFLQAMHLRMDLTSSLKKLKCRTLIFVGERSPFHNDALHMSREMDRKYNALVEVQACGSLVTEEIPHSMLIPLEYFLMGYGFYRPNQLTSYHSPSSSFSPPCISAELLSPQSLGLKLKPIKTKFSSNHD